MSSVRLQIGLTLPEECMCIGQGQTPDRWVALTLRLWKIFILVEQMCSIEKEVL